MEVCAMALTKATRFNSTKLSLMVGFALMVGTTARAESVTISLVQVGGTYDGVQAKAGDTLVLSIQYSVGDQGPTLIDPAIQWGSEVASFVGGTETGLEPIRKPLPLER
jgi:hypothetical protein